MYEQVIFCDCSAADEALAHLDEHGPDATIDYLAGNYYEAGTHPKANEPHGAPLDDYHEGRDGFVLSWNRKLNYIGLACKVRLPVTARQLGEQLLAAANPDAVVCLSVDEFGYSAIAETDDHTYADKGDGDIGNFLLRLENGSDVARALSPPKTTKRTLALQAIAALNSLIIGGEQHENVKQADFLVNTWFDATFGEDAR